jgi:CHAT domain-containing protein
LFASDVSSLRLDAGLVVLSACQSGLVGVTDYDDIGGLALAFLAGGADSVVATLWSVEDEATCSLMQAFYAELRSHSKAEALRLACLALLQTERFSHPSCWSPFVLMGDWRARISPVARDTGSAVS